MKKNKNLKIIGLALCMNASILTGCGKQHIKIVDYRHHIIYNYDENNTITSIKGTVGYYNVADNIRIVTLRKNDCETTKLMYIKYDNFDNLNYYDLKTGDKVVSYKKEDGEQAFVPSDDIEIIKSEEILPYLMADDNFKYDYDINEVMQAYNEKIKIKD